MTGIARSPMPAGRTVQLLVSYSILGYPYDLLIYVMYNLSFILICGLVCFLRFVNFSISICTQFVFVPREHKVIVGLGHKTLVVAV